MGHGDRKACDDVICRRQHCLNSSTVRESLYPGPSLLGQKKTANAGDIVTVELSLKPNNGFIPEPLFDSDGRISFILAWGNYLPAIHELVVGKGVGESVQDVTVDAGWGGRQLDLIVQVPIDRIPLGQELVPGETTLCLKGGLQVLVVAVDDHLVTLDANTPLAGSSYSCSFTIMDIEDGFSTSRHPYSDCCRSNSLQIDSSRKGRDPAIYPSPITVYRVAVFSLGCFWGAELAFMRVHGVVGTRVGYVTGRSGKRREAVLAVYNPAIVSYQAMVEVALGRLQDFYDPSKGLASFDSSPTAFHVESSDYGLSDLFREEDDEEEDLYKTAIYFLSAEQAATAEGIIVAKKEKYGIDLLPLTIFYDADEHHQQYLYKGGQSAKKGAKEKIRCYG